jgi:hypothetical protein
MGGGIYHLSHGLTPAVFIKDTFLTTCCLRQLQYRYKYRITQQDAIYKTDSTLHLNMAT